MGQQQIMLIILAVLIIGIAMAIGVTLFVSQSIESNRDAIISDIRNLNGHAFQYYIRPATMGGGGRSFLGYRIPGKMATTDNGTYVPTIGTTTIGFTGTSSTGNGTVTCTFNALTGKITAAGYTFTGAFDD